MRRVFPWLYADKSDSSPEEGAVVAVGGKVVLREKTVDDFRDDYAWRADEELARLDAAHPVTMSYDAFSQYARDELQYTKSTSKRLSIDTSEGLHIGNCMYYDFNRRRRDAELGIMIGDRRYWGAGYGTDAVRTLLDYIFTATPIERIYLHTLHWNARARRSFAKAGFHEVGPVFRHGHDFIKMEIRKEEWDEDRRTSIDDDESAESRTAPAPDSAE